MLPYAGNLQQQPLPGPDIRFQVSDASGVHCEILAETTGPPHRGESVKGFHL